MFTQKPSLFVGFGFVVLVFVFVVVAVVLVVAFVVVGCCDVESAVVTGVQLLICQRSWSLVLLHSPPFLARLTQEFLHLLFSDVGQPQELPDGSVSLI